MEPFMVSIVLHILLKQAVTAMNPAVGPTWGLVEGSPVKF